MIKLQNIDFYYDKSCILENISFDIQSGEKIVLLGTNGSGKSTLLKILNGLLYFKTGHYYYKDKEITKKILRDKSFNLQFRKEVVLLFQNPDSMLFNPTVFDEIAFGLRQILNLEEKSNKNLEKIVEEKVKYWADRFNLYKYLDKSAFQLSGGEKQKVCLASLISLEPKLLLLDEPIANLDPKTTGWFVEFLQELNITTIISTHNLSLASELGDKAFVLSENHHIIYEGEILELLKDKEKLINANLAHSHRHKHKDFKNLIEHNHFHIHEW